MGIENQNNDSTEQNAPTEAGKKIHQTHFSVRETHLQENDTKNDYEWVGSGLGRVKRVLKKLQTVIIGKK
jgi:hypothetical protein